MVGLGFKDNWTVGEYDLLLVRGDTYQKLDRFKFCVLKDITVDLSQKAAGVIRVAADGWLDIATTVLLIHWSLSTKSRVRS